MHLRCFRRAFRLSPSHENDSVSMPPGRDSFIADAFNLLCSHGNYLESILIILILTILSPQNLLGEFNPVNPFATAISLIASVQLVPPCRRRFRRILGEPQTFQGHMSLSSTERGTRAPSSNRSSGYGIPLRPRSLDGTDPLLDHFGELFLQCQEVTNVMLVLESDEED